MIPVSVFRRRPFLYESVHAGATFLVGEGARDHARGELIGLGHSQIHLLIEGALAGGEGFRRLLRNLESELGYGGLELIGRNHFVDQAPFERLCRVDDLTGEEHLHGALAQQVAAHRDPGRRAEKSPADSRGGELRRLGGDGEVALRDELAAGRGRRALHARDDRLRQRADRLHHAAALGEELLDLRPLLERADFLEIVAGAEAFSGSGQHDHTNSTIFRDCIESSLQSFQHRAREQVHLLRSVHGQRADGVAIIAQQDRLSGLRNSTHVSMALVDFAFSRSRNFWILPVALFGSSPTNTERGALNRARWPRQNSMISISEALALGFSSTKAHGVSPHFASGFATTAAASTAGWRYRMSSTSSEEMFSPPEIMMSFERSLILT